MAPRPDEDFLRAFHAAHPAVTSGALARGRTADGRSSYELLRDRVRGRRRVLDLGCGDGLLLELLAGAGAGASAGADARTLAGVDLSSEDLALARARPALAGAVLREARAQELPFPDGSFDACVSHMALMLMGEMDRVAAEAARVLAPGGVLVAALGGGGEGGEAYELFLDLARPLIDVVPADLRLPSLGDRRTRDRDGLDEILGPAGFAPVEWESVRIDLTGSAELVWRTMATVYDLGPLDAVAVAALREGFLAGADAVALPDGRVPCVMRMHIAAARRTAA